MGRVDMAGAAHLELVSGVVQLHPEDVMVEAMLSGWRAQQMARGLRECTIVPRERLVRRFLSFTSEYPWQWGPAHVDEWTQSLVAERRLAPSTIRGYQTDLRLFSEYLCDGRYGWATACEGEFGPAAPEFGRHGMLHVRYGKAKRGQPPRRRNVASVMGWAVEAVADYVENIRPRFGCDGHPALWVTERGGRIRPPEINARFEAYRDALGLPAALVVHSLRHAYVTHLTEDGVDRRFIQVQVGHESDSSTAVYTHVSDDFMNTALRKALAPAFEDHGRREDQQ